MTNKKFRIIISPTIELSKQLLPFIKTNTDFTFYMMFLVSLFFTTPYTIFFPRVAKDRIITVQNIGTQLEYLNNELAKKREELETLRKQSKKQNFNDTTIHTIDNSKYRAELKERLAILTYIRQYKDKLRKRLENGTLIDELRGLEIQPEDISFAEKH